MAWTREYALRESGTSRVLMHRVKGEQGQSAWMDIATFTSSDWAKDVLEMVQTSDHPTNQGD